MNDPASHRDAFARAVRSRSEPYDMEIEGVTVTVFPGVFPPATDTKLLARHLSVQPGTLVLDVTTGCGVLSVLMGLQGADGVASDINPQAVSNAEFNFRQYALPITPIVSDLFSKVPVHPYEIIIANGPYVEGEITDALDYAMYGARDFYTRFFSNVRRYLAPTGKVFMTIGAWGDVSFFEAQATACDLHGEVIDRMVSADGEREYLLYLFQS